MTDCQHPAGKVTSRTNGEGDTYEQCEACGMTRKMNNGGDKQWFWPMVAHRSFAPSDNSKAMVILHRK